MIRSKVVPLIVFVLSATIALFAQGQGELRGAVTDPTGAVIPGATVTVLKDGHKTAQTRTGNDGNFAFPPFPIGRYAIAVDAEGFASREISDINMVAGGNRVLNISLTIATQRQEVNVPDNAAGVGLNSDQNANALVLRGQDIEALSDDPDEMQSELQALAGPSAGPSGGEIYIDGFTGGQLPPKSSIREIRINQNPFSAEFDRLGYGRIEILTKPGTDKLHGRIAPYGNSSVFDTKNPLVQHQPSYYQYAPQGNISGPLGKNASFFFAGLWADKQNQNIVNAIDPELTTQNINSAVPNPSTLLILNPRIDVQVGKSNTLTFRDSFNRSRQSGAGVGGLILAQQGYDIRNEDNSFQVGDTIVVNPHLLNETHFQWRRIRNNQIASSSAPSVTVQGAFVNGGNNSGITRDNQDLFELQNYSTLSAGQHTIRFGARVRSYRDANYSTTGANGSYTFENLAQFNARTPSQYAVTQISNPLARLFMFDGSLFFQDEWRWRPNLNLSYGLRYEGQNRIRDHGNWAPRISVAWAPGKMGKTAPKTIIRAGYGWFYQRFIAAPSLGSATAATPYLLQTIHNNQTNQQNYVVANPTFFDPTIAAPPNAGSNTSIPYYYTVDHHFHAALDMQAGFGVDRQLSKKVSLSATYLFTRGIHQYFSNNVTAPSFDSDRYQVTGPLPAIYNYQFQSGAAYKQHQLILTSSTRFKNFVLNGVYTFNHARSNTNGVTSFVSIPSNPSLDYGRPNFGVAHKFTLLNSYTAPHGFVFASLFAIQSGTPFNITIGTDATGTNQFNARPTYGVCGADGVISTPYGCLDTDPAGKREKLVPYGLGTGPVNAIYSLRVSKTIGVGPRVGGAIADRSVQNESSVSGRGLSGGGAQVRLDASAPRKYNLSFVVGAANLFNIVNLAPPNGILLSPLFNKSQALASGPFASPTPGNRSIIFQMGFSF